MKYILWPFLRVAALVLLLLLTVSGFLRFALRALTGANQIPPPTLGCLLQFVLLPVFLPIMVIYFTSSRLYLEIMVLDVKLGFAKPEEALRVVAQTAPEGYEHWHMRFFALESDQEPFARQAEELTAKFGVSNAEILEEICQLEGMLTISFRGASRLTHAESNIIARKVNPLFRGLSWSTLFPVTEEANEEEITKWLNHPLINTPLPDTFVMNMAAHTPIPVATMERILRKLLQEDYDMYWRMAEARVRSKKQT